MNVYKLLIILILTLLFIYFNRNIEEKFITWYLPFWNKGTYELTKGTPKYITSNLEYNYLEYEYIEKLNVFILNKLNYRLVNNYYRFLFANVLKSMQVKKLEMKYSRRSTELLKKVNDDVNTLAVVSSPVLIETISSNMDLMEKINIIIVSNYRYLFFITSKMTQISSLQELDGKIVNTGEPETDENYLGLDILENLYLTSKINPKKVTNYDIQTSFKKLILGEIDGMFFTDLYPSEILDNYILNDLDKILVIIPIQGIDYSLFKTRHAYMEEVALDLNTLPPNYLPVKVKNLFYDKFQPDLISFRYPDFIVCNKNCAPRISFNMVKAIVSNLKIINQSNFYLKNGWNYMAFPGIANSMFIPTHIGAKIFYNSVSVNTTVPDENCKYFIGNAKCNDVRLEGARISANMI